MKISLEAYEKMLDRIEELRTENDKLWNNVLAEQNWIEVKDRLPKDNERVLVWFKPGNYKTKKDLMINIATFSKGDFYIYIQYRDNTTSDIIAVPYNIDHVTHWMPLPEPPKEEE